MIVRLWRARLRPGSEAELLERIRSVIPRLQGPDRPLDFTYGSRHEDGATHYLTVSVWPDFAALVEATAGDVSRPVYGLELDDLCETNAVETYERLPPAPEKLDLADGRVLGLVWGRVKPNHEGVAQSMIDRSAAAALGAGALQAHLGRRLSAAAMEVLVVVVWPQRETMARFVRSRDMPAIDPAFAAHLSDWRFETFNGLAPDRLLVRPTGLRSSSSMVRGGMSTRPPGSRMSLGSRRRCSTAARSRISGSTRRHTLKSCADTRQTERPRA